MTTPTVSIGDVIDLTIRFGNQVRHKCVSCKRYFSPQHVSGEPMVVACACGATYVPREGGEYEVLSLP